MGEAVAIGLNALTNLLISLICIGFTWWLLIQLRLDDRIKGRKPVHVVLFVAVLAIVLGNGLAQFLIQYLDWSRLVIQMLIG